MGINLKEMEREFLERSIDSIFKEELFNRMKKTNIEVNNEVVKQILSLSDSIADYYEKNSLSEYGDISDKSEFDIMNSIKKIKKHNPHLFPLTTKNTGYTQYSCDDFVQDIIFMYDYSYRYGNHEHSKAFPTFKKELNDFFTGKLQIITPHVLLYILYICTCASFESEDFGALIFYHFYIVKELNELYAELDYNKNSFFPWTDIVEIIYNQILFFEYEQYDNYIQTLDTLKNKIEICVQGINELKKTFNID